MSGNGSAAIAARVDVNSFGSHQRRVAAAFAPGSVEWLVALHHDHLEDDLGPVPDEIRAHVEVLTHVRGEDYFDYIRRVRFSGDLVAIAVKLSDARDNRDRSRGMYGGRVLERLEQRYTLVCELLSAAGSSAPR